MNCLKFRLKNYLLNGGDAMSLEEKLNQVKGSVKEGFGKLTGDKKTEAEGTASKAKEVAEDAKEAVEGAIKGVKNIFHKDDN